METSAALGFSWVVRELVLLFLIHAEPRNCALFYFALITTLHDVGHSDCSKPSLAQTLIIGLFWGPWNTLGMVQANIDEDIKALNCFANRLINKWTAKALPPRKRKSHQVSTDLASEASFSNSKLLFITLNSLHWSCLRIHPKRTLATLSWMCKFFSPYSFLPFFPDLEQISCYHWENPAHYSSQT